MQHVTEGFRMHQAMLDRHFEQAAIFETRERGIVGGFSAKLGVQPVAQPLFVSHYALYSWPVPGLIRRQAALDRIDPESEQLVKVRIERLQAKRFAKQIPIEGFQMAKIKN